MEAGLGRGRIEQGCNGSFSPIESSEGEMILDYCPPWSEWTSLNTHIPYTNQSLDAAASERV